MSAHALALRAAVWLGLAVLLTWPVAATPGAVLIGHPDVDVWNHAWGYWYVATELGSLSIPLATGLIGVPDGGYLYFIDALGAVVATPITWLFGPAVAYNGIMLIRIMLAGMAGQFLADEVLGKGLHGYVCGAMLASSPFLLSEMGNGISEVCAVHWVGWTLWATHKLMRAPSKRAWWRLGILAGITTVANFYYGLVSGSLLLWFGLVHLLPAYRAGWRPSGVDLRAAAQCAGIALSISLPVWIAFQWTLHADGALIVRPEALEAGWMLSHNAVDPRTYFMPGDFQSVDLAQYGEAFRHTGYLRWSALVLALIGVVRNRALWPWAVAGLGSLIVGLGPFLYLGEWVSIGGRMVSLPFYWLESLLPDIAITHPLRLSIGGQIILGLFASAGVAALPLRWLGPPLAALVVAESLLFSPATWPVPTASASVPEAYADLPNRPVLDLPGSVGKTMATSRYFWYQTAHGHPIPYSPNARLDSCRDLDVQASFTDPHKRDQDQQVVEHPAKGPDLIQAKLPERYGAIVLHTDLEERAELPSRYEPVLTRVFGPPKTVGDQRIWVFEEGGSP